MTVSKIPEPWRDHYGHPGGWDQTFPPLSMPDLFADAARRHADRTLADFEGRQFTYAALHAEARRFAAALQRAGIGKGDRVGLFLPNVPTYIPASYGAMIAGATGPATMVTIATTSEETATELSGGGHRGPLRCPPEHSLPPDAVSG